MTTLGRLKFSAHAGPRHRSQLHEPFAHHLARGSATPDNSATGSDRTPALVIVHKSRAITIGMDPFALIRHKLEATP